MRKEGPWIMIYKSLLFKLLELLNSTSYFHYVKIYFGVLHMHTRPNTSWGSKLPHLQVGALKLFPIRCVRRGSCHD